MATESIKARCGKVPEQLSAIEMQALLQSILVDLAALRTALNAHTHGGVTVGAGSTGVASVATMGTLNTTV